MKKINLIILILVIISCTNVKAISDGEMEATLKTLVGVDTNNSLFNTLEKTGGTSSIKLNVNQIPSLSVTGTTNSTGSGYSIGYTSSKRTTDTKGAHSHTFYNGYAAYMGGGEGYTTWVADNYGNLHNYPATNESGAHTHQVDDAYANSISGVQAHTHPFTGYYTNNSQASVQTQNPYITVYMYKRTA